MCIFSLKTFVSCRHIVLNMVIQPRQLQIQSNLPTLCPGGIHQSDPSSAFGFHFYSIYRSRRLWLHCWSTFCWIPRSLWGRLHKTRLLHLRPFGRGEDKGPSIRNQVASFTPDPSLAFLIITPLPPK